MFRYQSLLERSHPSIICVDKVSTNPYCRLCCCVWKWYIDHEPPKLQVSTTLVILPWCRHPVSIRHSDSDASFAVAVFSNPAHAGFFFGLNLECLLKPGDNHGFPLSSVRHNDPHNGISKIFLNKGLNNQINKETLAQHYFTVELFLTPNSFIS